MCRGISHGGRRCPSSSPARRSAYRKAHRANTGSAGGISPSEGNAAEQPEDSLPTLPDLARARELLQSNDHQAACALLGIDPPRDGERADATVERISTAVGAAVALHAEQRCGVTADAVHAKRLAEEAAFKEVQGRWTEANKEYVEAESRYWGLVAEKRLSTDAKERIALQDRIEEVQRNKDELARVRDAINDTMRQMPNGQCREELAQLAGAYHEVLSELRPMGADLEWHEKTTRPAAKAFNEAAAWFPTDWGTKSNNGPPMLAKVAKSRAHYAHMTSQKVRKMRDDRSWHMVDKGTEPSSWYGADNSSPWRSATKWTPGMDVPEGMGTPSPWPGSDTWLVTSYDVKWTSSWGVSADKPPAGGRWELWTDPTQPDRQAWRRPKKELASTDYLRVSEIKTNANRVALPGQSATLAVSVHELSHRMEQQVAGVLAAEREFLKRRVDQDEQLVTMYGGRKHNGRTERSYADDFPEVYMGKSYNGLAYELLSCGSESLFGGSYGGLVGADKYSRDDDMRAWVLGVFATH